MAITSQQLQEALNKAQSESGSSFATELRKRLETGRFDTQLSDIGMQRTSGGLKPVEVEAPVESGFGEFKEDVKQTISGVKERANVRADKFGEAERAFDAGEQGRGSLAIQKFGQGAGFASDLVGEAFKGAIKGILPQEQENKVKDFLTTIVGRTQQESVATGVKVGDEAEINLIKEYEKLKETNPQVARDIDAIGGIASLATEFFGVGQSSKAIKKVGLEAVEESAIQSTRFADNILKNSDEAQDAISVGVNRIKKTDPEAPKEFAAGLEREYNSAFVENKGSINNKLNKQAKVQGTTKEQLVRDLAEEGIIPTVNKGSKMADMNPALNTLDSRIESLAEGLDEALSPFTEKRTLEELRAQALAEVKASRFPKGQIKQGENFINQTFDSYAKGFPNGKLTAQEMNRLRIELNRQFKEGIDVDAAEVVGDIMRRNLEEVAPITTEVNQGIGRLIELRKTASVFNNVPIDVGVFGGQLGRMLGALGAGIGGSAIAGPGGLVISGIAAHYGGNIVAQGLRSRKFSKEAVGLLEEALKRDDALLQRMIDTADTENKAIFQRLLPEAGGSSFKETTVDLPEVTPSTVEAREATRRASGEIKTDSGLKAKGETSLTSEATKYKSADEFVEAQGEAVYHGGDGTNKVFSKTQPKTSDELLPNFSSDKKFASAFGIKGKEIQVYVSSKKPVVFKAKINKSEIEKLLGEKISSLIPDNLNNSETFMLFRKDNPNGAKLIKALREEGYDSIKFKEFFPREDRMVETVLPLNVDNIKTKSQLTDIWKKANER
jgi:hypothetical protein